MNPQPIFKIEAVILSGVTRGNIASDAVEGSRRRPHHRNRPNLSARALHHRALISHFAAHRPQKALAIVGLLFGTTLALCAQCNFARKFTSHTLTYRFHPEVTPTGLVLHVTLELQTDSSGTRPLGLPTQWAGETLHSLSNLHTLSVDAVLEDGPDANTKVLRAKPNRRVIVGYDLKKDFPGPLVHPMQFHPVLMPEYLEFTGSNALVAPKLGSADRVTVNFDWHDLPGSWALATSFGTSSSQSGRCQSHTGPWIDIDEGLYTAGDFRIHNFKIGRRPAVLAIRGAWKFTDEEAIQQIATVIGTVRSFWHDDSFPYFLVTVKPYDRDHGSSDGSAFTNAFWMYVSRLDSLNGLLPQLAHESFHAWDPKRMGLYADEESIKWFREGPTEYYAQLLTLKAGEISPSAYITSLNNDLRKFPVSDSEYVRGRIISLWLDATIRRESDHKYSLDNVMFDMVRDGRQPLTLERIFATSGHYLSPASLALLRDAVTKHADLPAPSQVPSAGLRARLVLEDRSIFELGLDLPHSTATGIVTGVVPNSPAYMAGLRDGQKLHGHLSVDNGNPDRLAIFTISTETGDREIKFYPRGKTISAWQYHLDQSNSCH